MINAKKMIILLIGLVFVLIVSSGWAQDNYPNRPIQLIVPYAPGGTLDPITRLVAERLREHLGQPAIVVNKPGAGSALGASYVATSKPDGYTLLVTTSVFANLPLLNPNVSYKLSDFCGIGTLTKYGWVLFVHKDLPVKTLPELVDYIKKNPKTLSYSSTGAFGAANLLFELLNIILKVNLNIEHVPYTGLGPALTAVLGNHSQASILPISSVVRKHIESKEIRPLTIFSPQRSRFLPDVPTSAEQGFPEMIQESYIYFMGPARIPAPVIMKLEGALKKIAEEKEFQKRVEDLDYTVEFNDPATAMKVILDYGKKWEPVMKKGNVTEGPSK